MIECSSIYGNKVLIPKAKLILRPTAYAVVVDNGKILLVKSRHRGKYCLPGGGIKIGERMEIGLKREVKEETGIEIKVVNLAHFLEDFFYYDPLDEAYHGLIFYYICIPLTFDLLDNDHVKDDDAEQPQWIAIKSLQAQDLTSHGEIILSLLQARTVISSMSPRRG